MTTRYTRLCIQCPAGQQRGPERETTAAAVADLACQHARVLVETWTRWTEVRRIDGEDVEVGTGTLLQVPIEELQ